MLKSQDKKSSMYFVHSYKAECNKDENILATTSYNDVNIAAVIKTNNASKLTVKAVSNRGTPNDSILSASGSSKYARIPPKINGARISDIFHNRKAAKVMQIKTQKTFSFKIDLIIFFPTKFTLKKLFLKQSFF